MSLLHGKHILVIDDEVSNRDIIANHLEELGAICIEASNGLDAFDLYKNNNFDVVVSDVCMPNGDAIEFMQNIKAHQLPLKPVIFISGFTTIPVKDMYDLGVEALVTKPFKLDHLVSTICEAMLHPRNPWRKYPRINALFDVTLSFGDKLYPVYAKTFNISKGGVFIHLAHPLPKMNDQVHFKLKFNTNHGKDFIEGDLLVHWVREKVKNHQLTGFGAEFIGVSEEKLSELFSLVSISSNS